MPRHRKYINVISYCGRTFKQYQTLSMETKSGIEIPPSLSSHLENSKTFKDSWDKLRPSCQKDYVERINKAKTDKVAKTKLERIIELTCNYAKKHPDKYKEVKIKKAKS